VRLESFYLISPKCYKAIAFDGSEALIPASQYFGQDCDVSKSEAYWISEWILSKNSQLQHSNKKWTIFSKEGKNIGQISFEHHVPKKLNKETITHDATLKRPESL
jgi:hypothetical protein